MRDNTIKKTNKKSEGNSLAIFVVKAGGAIPIVKETVLSRFASGPTFFNSSNL